MRKVKDLVVSDFPNANTTRFMEWKALQEQAFQKNFISMIILIIACFTVFTGFVFFIILCVISLLIGLLPAAKLIQQATLIEKEMGITKQQILEARKRTA